MRKEFRVLSDIYTIPDEDGNQKVIKKNILTKMYIDNCEIKYTEEIFNNKGTVLKGVCVVKLTDGEIKRLKHTYQEVKDFINIIHTPTPIIGFGGNRQKKK